jgi:hypothetical protein
MDIETILAELHRERELLDQEIFSLEWLSAKHPQTRERLFGIQKATLYPAPDDCSGTPD